jgi:hypothetical protein
MPRLLNRAPIPKDPWEVAIRGERVRIRADQILIWITLSARSSDAPNPLTIPFPAIVDTGHTHSFSIQERQLTDWAGLRPENLRVSGTARDRGLRLLLRKATIWAYPVEPRSCNRLADRLPHQLSAPHGIAIYPSPGHFPRLPILGLRSIADNKLTLVVDGQRREATLRTSIRWWPFA